MNCTDFRVLVVLTCGLAWVTCDWTRICLCTRWKFAWSHWNLCEAVEDPRLPCDLIHHFAPSGRTTRPQRNVCESVENPRLPCDLIHQFAHSGRTTRRQSPQLHGIPHQVCQQ